MCKLPHIQGVDVKSATPAEPCLKARSPEIEDVCASLPASLQRGPGGKRYQGPR